MVMTKKSRLLAVCCFSLIFLLGSISPVCAIDLSNAEREYLRTKGTIVFVSQTRYPPFEFTDAADKQHEGMMLDIARCMAVEMGFKPVFIDMTFQQAQEAVLSGKADILTSLFYSDQRKERFEFTETLFDVPVSIFVRAERTDIKDINDLNGKTIAIQRGDYAKDFLESQKIRFDALDTNDFAEATDRVIAGKADAVIGDEQIVFYHIFSNRLTDYTKKVGEPLYIGRNCMASNKNNAILIRILNKGINEARKSGVLDKISTKWLGTKYGPRKSFLERYLWQVAAVAGGLLLLSLWVWIWNVRLRTLVRKKTEVITRREEALRDSEEKYRNLFENANEAMFVAQDGKLVFLNPRTAMITGYSSEELISRPFIDFIHPDDREIVIDRHVRRMKGEELPHRYPFRIIHRDGNIRWVELNAVLINWNGKAATLNFLSDITDRKQMESDLRKSETEKTVILESVSDMIFYIDTDMRVIYSNLALEKFFNMPSGCLGGKVCYNALHHRDKPCHVCPALRAMQSGKPHESYVSSFGRHWLLSGYPVREESGAITGAIEVVSDITNLRNAEEKYRSIFDNATEGIYQSTPDGRIISANPALAKMFGYDSPESMMSEVASVGRSLYAYPDKRQEFLRMVEEQGIAKNFEFEGSKKDGERIYVSDNARAVKDSQGNTLYYEGIIQDITERKRVEDALRESEERFRALSENAPDIIYTMNLEGAITYANPSWKRILGHDKDEILGRCFTDFVREEDRRTHRKLFKSIRDDGKTVSNYIGIMMTKDEAERVFSGNSAFIRDSKGRIISVVGTMKDITEQREMEKKLSHAQKLEAIGTLAGGIAHDFNNLLMGIQGYASLTLLDIDASHPHYERLKRIEEQVQSGADLTKQLLGFARGGRYEVRPTDMNDIIDKASYMFARTKKEIAVHRSLAQDLWIVDVDQGQMEQVLMNLYVNAWQAMPGGGELYLETGNVLLGDDPAMSYTITPGRYVKVSITDTGTGMDEKTRERIFDPFFTTKAMGRGTGLGLAMVYGIIKGHGGMINVTSEPGQGTTFDIYLPASEKTIDKEKTAAREILTGTETVLLVDDEPFVLGVTGERLESL
ncbi:MAG: hypothetical protein CVU74_05955, partial [Deltaproteobacteria bacterium HGW-Deltaproteobacteria-9]